MSGLSMEYNIHSFDSFLTRLPEQAQLSLKTLPLLEEVTCQLLRFLSANTLRTTLSIIADKNGKRYRLEQRLYKSLFTMFVKLVRMYTKTPSVLRVSHILPGIWKPHHPPPSFIQQHEVYIILVLRKANVCMFLLALIGELPFGISFLADNFVEIFCFNVEACKMEDYITTDKTKVIYGRLLKPQTILFLDLMTQYYITALISTSTEHTRESTLLEDIFPDTILDKYRHRTIQSHGRSIVLEFHCIESDFVQRCARRKISILETPTLEQLCKKYDWEECCKDLYTYAAKKGQSLLLGKRSNGNSTASSLAHKLKTSSAQPASLSAGGCESDISTIADDVSKDASQPLVTNRTTPEEDTNTSKNTADVPAAALVKQFKTKPKQKKRWTTEEEETLKEGLQQFGSAWSNILYHYGPGGTVSEALKNRSQVQLKDKARNWKMHYLKGGKPVPSYLENVTGDIKRGMSARKKSKIMAPSSSSTLTDSLAQPASASASEFKS